MIALGLRLYYFSQLPVDRLDDSYTRWLISTLTVRNGWVYSDIRPMPNLALVYLPLYQYVSALGMSLTANPSITAARYVSIIAGTATCVAVASVGRRLYASVYFGTLAGLFLAVQPWHIDFSVAGTEEALTGLLATAAFYFILTSQRTPAITTTALTALTGYEGWILLTAGILAIILMKHRSTQQLRAPVLTLLASILAWILWSAANTRNTFAWITTYLDLIGWVPTYDFSTLLFYPTVAFVMTTTLFLFAIYMGFRNGKTGRIFALVLVIFLSVFTLGAPTGIEVSDIDRLVPLLPFMALALVPGLPRIQGTALRKATVVGILLILLLLPYFAQIPIGPRKLFVISPEQRAADMLREQYSGGKIVTDSATVIYFSQIDPTLFLTFDHIMKFLETAGPDKLAEWFRSHQVSLLVWQNSTHSRAAELFPQLGAPHNYSPNSVQIGRLLFVLVYEDSLAAGNWEHDPLYFGPPAIYLYRIEILS